jgi:hypothetical protein
MVSACEEVARILGKISGDLERDLYVQKIAQRLGIKEIHLLAKMETIPKNDRLPAAEKSGVSRDHKMALLGETSAEKLILQVMLLHPDIVTLVEEKSFLKEFTSPVLQEVGTLLCKIYKQHGAISMPHLLNMAQDESLKKWITEIFMKEDSHEYGANPTRILEDCIQKLRLKKLKLEMEKLYSFLKKAELAKDKASCLKYQLDWQRLLEERKRIQEFKITAQDN